MAGRRPFMPRKALAPARAAPRFAHQVAAECEAAPNRTEHGSRHSHKRASRAWQRRQVPSDGDGHHSDSSGAGPLFGMTPMLASCPARSCRSRTAARSGHLIGRGARKPVADSATFDPIRKSRATLARDIARSFTRLDSPSPQNSPWRSSRAALACESLRPDRSRPIAK